MNKKIDVSSYLIVGPENTNNRPVSKIVLDAVNAGFTTIQLRSKVASARQMIELCRECAAVLSELKKSDSVSLLVNDRLDIVLAAREKGIKVDGIHVGQKDIPPEVCRKYLGENAIVGLSAQTWELLDYVKNFDSSQIDYFGTGPFHQTESKKDAGLDPNGNLHLKSVEELSELKRISKIPVVVGGGVKLEDLPSLKKTGVDGFFVISAVCGAENTYNSAKELVDAWNSN